MIDEYTILKIHVHVINQLFKDFTSYLDAVDDILSKTK